MHPRSKSKKNWHARAARVRALAVTMADTQAGILLADLAADYDKVGETAAIEARATGKVRDQMASPDKPRASTSRALFPLR